MSEHVSDEQLSCLIDGELSLVARETALAHLRGCPGCAERHDALVDAVAALRLELRLSWGEPETLRVLERVARKRRYELALPLALASSVLAGLLVVLELEAVRAAFAIEASALRATGAFLPSALAGQLVPLLALLLLAPVISLRLARWP